eukprot:COSAG04_NODE_5959_length_1447_cov_2.334570_2_plen_171_part_00
MHLHAEYAAAEAAIFAKPLRQPRPHESGKLVGRSVANPAAGAVAVTPAGNPTNNYEPTVVEQPAEVVAQPATLTKDIPLPGAEVECAGQAWVLEEQIGKGGYGRVFKTMDGNAIKFLKKWDTTEKVFAQEVKAMIRFADAGVVPCLAHFATSCYYGKSIVLITRPALCRL